MAIDTKTIGAFGVSFSRGMDQTWVNLWRKENGFLLEFFQNVEDMDSEEEDEIINVRETIELAVGDEILRRAFAEGCLEDWPLQYTAGGEGEDSDLTWTIDVDDLADRDLLLLSGNRKLPPDGRMRAVIAAVRLGEDRFMRCFPDFR